MFTRRAKNIRLLPFNVNGFAVRETAAVDGLLLLRSLMGLTGASVTNGFTFSNNATRRDWFILRAHLRDACGLASKIP